ncbi:hypothetical protein PYW07_002617 [Mythimna separata]|uniref:Peptidase S1 domain-containing protein n=1 Tax=Mythimna separata TaxID=271217 RepID=A0AAD7YG08_MYTSE|nr:hypothetical protein PYW07_002617 [Mythimna separata]
MKAFALVLLCALAAVQGRYTGLQTTRTAAALGENPYVVHLRIAVGTSGLLETCAGSLIGSRWVLTAASCVADARFIWLRYGVVNVINPELVLETTQVRPNNDIALVTYGRDVQSTDNIRPVIPVGQPGATGTVCAFGGGEAAGPGETLNCYEVDISEEDGTLTVSSDDFEPTMYDLGAAVVSDGAQVGLLVEALGKYVATSPYTAWIEQETGLVLSPAIPDVTTEAEPEASEEASDEASPEAVHFV